MTTSQPNLQWVVNNAEMKKGIQNDLGYVTSGAPCGARMAQALPLNPYSILEFFGKQFLDLVRDKAGIITITIL